MGFVLNDEAARNAWFAELNAERKLIDARAQRGFQTHSQKQKMAVEPRLTGLLPALTVAGLAAFAAGTVFVLARQMNSMEE